jgi:hypothetical protein
LVAGAEENPAAQRASAQATQRAAQRASTAADRPYLSKNKQILWLKKL